MKNIRFEIDTLLGITPVKFGPYDTDTDIDIVVPDTDTDTDSDLDLEFVVMEEDDQPYRVIIHNDSVTTFEFVINTLVRIFEQSFARATKLAFETHYKGNAYIATMPLEEAKTKVFKAQYSARQSGFPLVFTIEPEHDW
ncbi:ATP-dependent Clp protease adaptor ClpS [Anaerolineales bacterium HSG6]|nr:ATP-dependent Clp protease adaptor ClpS [Anaerolineales bacterium HSG6]MDM8530810.1 ATP-dependent Clp protease adaptor ClpS [Anaerolineales bacterium HSG25]